MLCTQAWTLTAVVELRSVAFWKELKWEPKYYVVRVDPHQFASAVTENAMDPQFFRDTCFELRVKTFLIKIV